MEQLSLVQLALLATAIVGAAFAGWRAVITYVQWRGTDSWRSRRVLRLTGRLPSEVPRWSLRHNLTDALWWPDPQNRSADRRRRKLEDLYRCPRVSSCVPPVLCEACERRWDLDGQFMTASARLAAQSAQRRHTFIRRQHGMRPWRLNWQPARQ